MSDNVREALGVLASKWATGSSDDLADDTYQRAFNAARYRCAQELRAALAAPSSESPAATGSGDEADRLDALRAQRSVVTRNYARDPSNENEAALYAICERVYAAERKVAAATGSGAATGPRDEAVDPDAPIKCGTFGGVTIPPDVRARMDADRAAAEASAPKPHGFPPVYYFADDAQGNPCLFWRNPFSGEPESLARFMWPTHPKEWDVDGWWEKFTLTVVAALNPPPFTLKGGPRE